MEGVGGEGEQPTHVESVHFSTPRITVQDVRGRINRRTVYYDSSTKCFVILASTKWPETVFLFLLHSASTWIKLHCNINNFNCDPGFRHSQTLIQCRLSVFVLYRRLNVFEDINHWLFLTCLIHLFLKYMIQTFCFSFSVFLVCTRRVPQWDTTLHPKSYLWTSPLKQGQYLLYTG